MRKTTILVAMLMALMPLAWSQNKMLQWDDLMSRELYPQREAMSFIFAPDGKTVTYYKGGEYYGCDGTKEFKLTEDQQDWRKPKDNDPKLEERVELKEGNLYVDGTLVAMATMWCLAKVCIATNLASTEVSFGHPRPTSWPSTVWIKAWWRTIPS